jgi:hypothetical protein
MNYEHFEALDGVGYGFPPRGFRYLDTPVLGTLGLVDDDIWDNRKVQGSNLVRPEPWISNDCVCLGEHNSNMDHREGRHAS